MYVRVHVTHAETGDSMSKQTDAVRDACMNAATPAAFARVIEKPGKSLRDVLRSRFGVYVSKTPDAWTPELRAALYAYVVDGDKDAADTYKDAQAK